MFGWTAAEAAGRALSEMIIAPADRRDYAGWMMAASFETGPEATGRRVEFRGLQRSGRQFPMELSLAAVERPGGMSANFFIRDLTAVRRSEMLRGLEYAVAGALTAAESAEQATQSVVASVGEGLSWPYVEYWHLSDGEQHLVRAAAWSRNEEMTAPMRVVGTFARGHGVVGQVWDSSSAQWITDLPHSDTPRAAAAEAAKLCTVVAVPVRNGTDVVGVLAAFSRRAAEPDTELMAALDTVAAHIGQFMHRRRAQDLELQLSRARSEFDRIIANLSDYLWTVQAMPDGTMRIVYASPNTEIFGGPAPSGPDLGRSVLAVLHPEDRGLYEEFSRGMAAEQPTQMTSRFIGADGVTRWVWTRAVPRREDDELFIDGVCSDVTERHRDHARLRQQAELLDLAPTAIIVRDLEDRITYWNRGAQAMYGWRRGGGARLPHAPAARHPVPSPADARRRDPGRQRRMARRAGPPAQ